MKTIKFYEYSLQGYGCFERTIEINEIDIISETPVSVSVKNDKVYYEDDVGSEILYITDINEFILEGAENPSPLGDGMNATH